MSTSGSVKQEPKIDPARALLLPSLLRSLLQLLLVVNQSEEPPHTPMSISIVRMCRWPSLGRVPHQHYRHLSPIIIVVFKTRLYVMMYHAALMHPLCLHCHQIRREVLTLVLILTQKKMVVLILTQKKTAVPILGQIHQ